MMKQSILISLVMSSALLSMQSLAANHEVRADTAMPQPVLGYAEQQFDIDSVDDSLDHSLSKASRPCPPFCVNPMNIEDAVDIVAELEVMRFMETTLPQGGGILVDARTPEYFEQGTIPGSVNIPYTVFEKGATDPELVAVLQLLGAKQRGEVGMVRRTLEKAGLLGGKQKTDQWDFSEAGQLLLWCNGPWCGQSPRAIRALISLGYPADKLSYYRGGMKMWQSLGLATVVPADMSNYASK